MPKISGLKALFAAALITAPAAASNLPLAAETGSAADQCVFQSIEDYMRRLPEMPYETTRITWGTPLTKGTLNLATALCEARTGTKAVIFTEGITYKRPVIINGEPYQIAFQ